MLSGPTAHNNNPVTHIEENNALCVLDLSLVYLYSHLFE